MKNVNDIQNEIQNYLVRNPLKEEPKKAWRHEFPEEFEKAKAMRKEGLGISKISEKLGVSYEKIRKSFLWENVPLPEIIVRPAKQKQKTHTKGLVINPGEGCPCGVGMQDICTVHKWVRV